MRLSHKVSEIRVDYLLTYAQHTSTTQYPWLRESHSVRELQLNIEFGKHLIGRIANNFFSMMA